MADMNDVIERLIERTGEHRVPSKTVLDAFLELLDAAPPVSPPEPDRRRPARRP